MSQPYDPPAGTPIVIQQRESAFGRYGKWLWAIIGILVVTCIGMYGTYQSYFGMNDGLREKYHSLSREALQKIAIVNVSGAILESDTFVKKQIDRVRDDPSVVAVVLRINSPGGTVTQSDYLHHHLRQLIHNPERPLPMVVSMGSICASGGYYLAMAVGDQADSIYAEPTTWTGSIGVIIPHYDLSGLLAKYDVKDDSVMSHPLKEMGSPTTPLTDDERKLLQELVDVSFARFRDIVKEGRPLLAANPANIEAVTTGQVFTASQAQEMGLVDQLGFVEDAIDRAATLANVSPKAVRCVEYEAPSTPLAALTGSASAARDPLGMSMLVELTTPRAYYLYSLLPALIHSAAP